MVATTATVVIALATAVVPLVAGGAPVRPQVILALLAMVAVAAALAGWVPGFTLCAVALGTEYALRLVGPHGVTSIDAISVVESVGVFATVELGLRALDARSLARREPRVREADGWQFAYMLSAATAVAFLVLVLGTRELPAPTAGLALGLAAAATLMATAELLRRRVTRTHERRRHRRLLPGLAHEEL
jgi:hypothetical protein